MNRPETLSTRSSWHADLDHRRIVHAEDREQLPRKEQEEEPDERSAGEAEARRDVHGGIRAIGMPGAEVLAGDRGRGAHQARPTSR